jgi:flavin reductase (DIM6/NTAB) family NADH-FMN oxidoreductase RutF
MNMSFKEISPYELQMNPMEMVAKQWMLVTAGDDKTGYNTMTASWGHIGELWGLPTTVAYVRPQRYTKQFVDREDLYTLCFFDGKKQELA